MNTATIIILAVVAVLITGAVVLLLLGLKSGRELDERLDQLVNERYQYPKK